MGTAWVRPEHSREEINHAGKILVKAYSGSYPSDESVDEWAEYFGALDILNNWRGSHSYPLISLRLNLARVAKRFDKKPLIAQRIKRLVSIAAKLQRFPSMKLSQMQDLGGCRAILSNVSAVKDAVEALMQSKMLHDLASIDNYIDEPKASGYRGVHLVYRFKSNSKHKAIYNDLKIELQLRSAYQHAWATAVETVGTFSGQALKSSMGSEDWQTFFALMGSELALREKTPLVPATPQTRSALRHQLKHYASLLKVRERLVGYRRALSAISTSPRKDARFFLLRLQPLTGELFVNNFAELKAATAAYANAEKLVRDNKGTDAVLVSVDSISALGRAYPNYFADTRMFMQLMNQALAGRSRGIEVSPVPISIKPDTGQLALFGEVAPTSNGNGSHPKAEGKSELQS